MTKFFLIAIPIFLIITVLLWKFTTKYFKKENRENIRELRRHSTGPYEGFFLLSAGLTFLVLIVLKSTNLVVF